MAAAAAAAAALPPARTTEDVGYETAKIKGVDVLCQVAVMLRQRGLRIVRVVDIDIPPEEPNAAPLDGPPDATTVIRSEQWMRAVLVAVSSASLIRACTPNVGVTASSAASPAQPILPVIIAQLREPEAPPGTAARLHLERGLASDGDRTAVYMLPVGKIGVKQLRVVRDAIIQGSSAAPAPTPGAVSPTSSSAAAAPPHTVIVATREKVPVTALKVLRVQTQDGRTAMAEQFRLSELSYNLTRHYLVPKHRLCSMTEVSTLRRSFPKLALQSREDAVTRFYGLLPGDVMVYHRKRSVGLGGDYYREIS